MEKLNAPDLHQTNINRKAELQDCTFILKRRSSVMRNEKMYSLSMQVNASDNTTNLVCEQWTFSKEFSLTKRIFFQWLTFNGNNNFIFHLLADMITITWCLSRQMRIGVAQFEINYMQLVLFMFNNNGPSHFITFLWNWE